MRFTNIVYQGISFFLILISKCIVPFPVLCHVFLFLFTCIFSCQRFLSLPRPFLPWSIQETHRSHFLMCTSCQTHVEVRALMALQMATHNTGNHHQKQDREEKSANPYNYLPNSQIPNISLAVSFGEIM